MERQIAFTCGDEYLVKVKRREQRSIIKQTKLKLCFKEKKGECLELSRQERREEQGTTAEEYLSFGNYVNRFREKFGELSNYHTHTDDTTAHVPSTLTGTALAFNSVRIKLGKAPKWADMQV